MAIIFVYAGTTINVRRVMSKIAAIAFVLEIIYITLASRDNDAKQGVFLLWFEPVFWVRIAAAIKSVLNSTQTRAAETIGP